MGRRVAIYARVSTEHEAQISALGNQIQYYYEKLKSDLDLDENGMEMLMREVGAETQQELIDKWNANVDYLQNLQAKITSQLKMKAQKECLLPLLEGLRLQLKRQAHRLNNHDGKDRKAEF